MSGWTLAKAALTVPCPFCGAEVGQPCRTSGGRRSSSAHGPRSTPLIRAFSQGFNEGREIQRNIDSRGGGR
jgi:hypothetical protein